MSGRVPEVSFPTVSFSPSESPSSRRRPEESSVDRSPRYDVVGIGNALVDVIAHATDGFLHEHRLVKGSMTLIETERAVELYAALSGAVEMSGGSAANTVGGVASFGGRAAYIGKVDDDDLWQVFGHDMRAVGVGFVGGGQPQEIPTGRCVVVVTPDAERTMNTYLGVSSTLSVEDLDESLIAAGRVLYMEGYLFDRDDAKAAFRRAADVAHEHGRTVSLTLSDSFCVDRHRDDFRELVRDHIDLLFGNEDELLSLYELESFDDAVAALRSECSLAVITRGPAGCIVVTAEELIPVAAVPVTKVVDTTGAGDLFAAGFMYGYTHGADLAECGRLGSVAAAEVISHVGPRPLVELRTLGGDV
jgi:sugar/nucleoside kinase (ribokinase family)